MVLIVCFAILDVIGLVMMVLTIRSCARSLDPMHHIRNYPEPIRGQVLDVIPETTYLESLPDRVT